MSSIHPHIQRFGPGHRGKNGNTKISYTSKQQAREAALRRSILLHPYPCGDHWHLHTKHWKNDQWVRGYFDADTELGERVSVHLQWENREPERRFRSLGRTVTRKRHT